MCAVRCPLRKLAREHVKIFRPEMPMLVNDATKPFSSLAKFVPRAQHGS